MRNKKSAGLPLEEDKRRATAAAAEGKRVPSAPSSFSSWDNYGRRGSTLDKSDGHINSATGVEYIAFTLLRPAFPFRSLILSLKHPFPGFDEHRDSASSRIQIGFVAATVRAVFSLLSLHPPRACQITHSSQRTVRMGSMSGSKSIDPSHVIHIIKI